MQFSFVSYVAKDKLYSSFSTAVDNLFLISFVSFVIEFFYLECSTISNELAESNLLNLEHLRPNVLLMQV